MYVLGGCVVCMCCVWLWCVFRLFVVIVIVVFVVYECVAMVSLGNVLLSERFVVYVSCLWTWYVSGFVVQGLFCV